MTIQTIKSKVRRTALTVGMLFALPLIISLSLAVPAQASYLCPSGAVCIYDQTNGDGQRYAAYPGVACHTLPSYANNMADSYFNVSGRSVSFYANSGCTGDILQWGNQPVPNNGGGNFAFWCEDNRGTSCRNILSSIRFY